MFKTKNRIGVGSAALVVVLAGSSSCSHQSVTSGTAGLTVQYEPSPSGAGRYDRATMDVSSIFFVPTDPDRAALYGNPLSFGPGFTVDLTSGAPFAFSTAGLAPGSYTITDFSITTPTFADDNPPNPPATCIENFGFLPSGPAVGDVPFSYSFGPADGFHFTVHTGQTKLSMRLDVPAMISGYENAFTCLNSCNGGGPCLSAFDAAAFRTTLLTTISFQ